ncbi:MAG: hypothetical protein P8188_17305 [Gemmatimonadota bacterium]
MESAELVTLEMEYVGSVRRTLTYEVPRWPGWDQRGIELDSITVLPSGGGDEQGES